MSSIYEYEKNLVGIERRIQTAGYSQENKELIYRFQHVLFAEGIKLVRVLKYMAQLNILARDYNLDLKNATKDDIYRVVAAIERKDLSEYTKYGYKVTIKRFYRWMNGGEDPEITKWIKPRTGEKKKLPEELLTESDVKRMILAADHLRDKALVAVLYDSGARISEIGNLKLKHVVFDQYGAVLTVDGKTGMRRVRVIFSAPYLASWIDMHPGKSNPESFLWINVGQRNRGAHMRYPGFSVLIKRIAKNAGIEKRVYNHLFRHSRSTELSQHLTEAQMEEHLGWIHGSKMPRTYIHMSGRQMDDAILKIHGILKKEDLKPELTSVTCPRCEHVNGPTSDFCSKCGMTLTIQAAADVEKKRSDIAMALMELVEKDPEVAKVLRGVME